MTEDEGMEMAMTNSFTGQDSFLGGENGSASDTGKKFQKEKTYLRLLPYYESLKKETSSMLEKIIRYLVTAVLRQDFQDGVVSSTKQLSRYVEMYGLKFTKGQHIHLINLYMELLTMKTCPLNLIPTLTDVLSDLLERSRLLTRDDISIPWRPLYEILKRCDYTLSPTVSADLEKRLYNLIWLCNKYWEEGTFVEVVAELKPLLCPSSLKMKETLQQLQSFIPYADPTAEEDVGKFMEELWEYFVVWINEPQWEWSMMGVFALTMWHMPRSLDWTPHLPMIYLRLMKKLGMPVYFKGLYCPQKNNEHFESRFAALLVLSTLGNNRESMFHFKNFFNSVETFFHPSNDLLSRTRLGVFLGYLSKFFLGRVKSERYREQSKQWWYRWPENKKLTDNDIDDIVKIISNLMLTFYLDADFCGPVMRDLAVIHPRLIIPAVMAKYSETVDTVTEPEKYRIVLGWISSSLMPMIHSRSRKENVGYDGRQLVLPLAKSLLPAIDPNDMEKTICALNLLTDVVLLIPLVDCSALADKAETDEEKELCRATACLEELVLQILERVMSLIRCRTLEDTRIMDNCGPRNVFNDEDKSLERVFWPLFLGIGNHASTQICKSAANNLVGLALKSNMEIEVSGRLFAGILQGFVVSRPDIFLPVLLPQLCSSIENLVTDDMLNEEQLNAELLFHLLLLSKMMATNGKELIKYRLQIEAMLTTVLRLNGKKGYCFTAMIIKNLLQSLVLIYPLENRISEADFDDPDYMAIRDWGVTVDPSSVKPTWHLPSEKELNWAKHLFFRIFTEYSAKFEVINGCTVKQEDFNKRLLKYIWILRAAYDGINTLLKFWDETPVEETLAYLTASTWHCGIPKVDISTPETGKNIVLAYYKMYCSLQAYLEKFKADDTDAFYALMNGFCSLLVPVVAPEKRSNLTWSIASLASPKKLWTRRTLINHAYDLHFKQMRMIIRLSWTLGHASVLRNIFQLCINRYATVRLSAQTFFFGVINKFSVFAHLIPRCIQPLLIERLQEDVPHDEYKGALFIICGWNTLLLKSRWQDLCDLWIAIIRSPFSEKNSIIVKMADIENTIAQNFIPFPLEQEVAKCSKLPQIARKLVSEKEWEWMDTLDPIDTSASSEHYVKLVKSLIEVGSNSDSHWRKKLMASNMLRSLVFVNENNPMTEELVTFYLNGVVSTISHLRESAMTVTASLLKFFKREYPLVTIDTKNDLQFAPGESIHSVLLYSSSPTNTNDKKKRKYRITSQSTSSELYVHKMHHGFAALPTYLTLKQPVINFSDMSTQSESQRLMIKTMEKFFTDEKYVTLLMEFWSLEKHALIDSMCISMIVKYIARNNGPKTLRLLLQSARKFGMDKDMWKQRCAADVIGGILLGIKLWDDKMLNEFWTELLRPILTECLDSVTQETTSFWNEAITATTYNRDPNKLRFFFEFLKERFISSLSTAHTTSIDIVNEMGFLYGSMCLVEWRGGEAYFDTFALIKKDFFHTPNPYRSVRLHSGLLLAVCMSWDVKYSTVGCDLSPKHEPFVCFLLEALDSLEAKAANYHAAVKSCEINEEIRELLLKFKTILEWIQSTIYCMTAYVNPMMFRFIPTLCQFENFESDPEVMQLCDKALVGLANALVPLEHFEGLLRNLRQAAGLSSWKARICVLEFLKVFVLNHISILASEDLWAEEVRILVLKLLSDRKVEVREAAYEVLSGLLHCLLIKDPIVLLSKFRKDAISFATQRRENKRLCPKEVDALHSGILGLCAFVHANQYHVPQYLPDVLILLTTHLSDPQPIPETIRKCLRDFRHRHQDDWNKHKTMFTEDQLCLLNDVFVSPNYYV